jgi:alpha-methylacyl-CoA racemase
MILADFGADVIRIDRPSSKPAFDILNRGKRSIQLDLKASSSKPVLEKLLDVADVLIEPFRPGVLESLGYYPEVLRKNEKLIVARLTGFRRDGISTISGIDNR